MKIIKQGKIPDALIPWWVGYNITCHHCGTEVILENGDIVNTHIERRVDGYKTFEISCPTCYKYTSKTIPGKQ